MSGQKFKKLRNIFKYIYANLLCMTKIFLIYNIWNKTEVV